MNSIKCLLALSCLLPLIVYANGSDLFHIDTHLPYRLHNECSKGVMQTDASSGITTFTLSRNNGKRCEIAIHDLLKRETPFSLRFEFRVNSKYEKERYWHSMLQIHSFPDKNEAWRCPIMALENQVGSLRMFRRWDHQKKSSPGKWGCADDTSSIQYVTFFKDVPYQANHWNSVELTGTLGLSKNNCLTIKINDFTRVSCGPNTFNDERHPFLKFGIYKPTSWSYYSKIALSVRHVEFD